MTGRPTEPVLTVTLNPAIDLELHIAGDLRRGSVVRAKSSTRVAGGKGINVSRALAELGVGSAAAFAIGGTERALFMELLGAPAFAIHALAIGGGVRTNVTAAQPGRGYIFKINQAGPTVTPEETEAILKEIARLVRGRKWVVISGSLPLGMPPETYARIVKLAHDAKASVAIDCEAEPLMKAVDEKPELVKINRKELAATLGRPLRGQASVINAVRELRRRGAGLIVVSDGPRSGLALDAEETIQRALPPKIFKARVFGAGDIMLASLIAELLAGKTFVEAFKEATSRAADAVGKLMQ